MITSILLAAGESNRMGRNKLLLEIKGKRVIDVNLDIVKEVVDDNARYVQTFRKFSLTLSKPKITII